MTAGTLIVGRYLLSEPVGEGGLGRVWRGRDKLLNRDVAVTGDPAPGAVTARKRRTAPPACCARRRAAARLDHPGVVTIHDVVEHGDALWIDHAACAGDVASARRYRPASPAAVGSGRHGSRGQAAEVLARAHGAGLVHGDLKPGNILA